LEVSVELTVAISKASYAEKLTSKRVVSATVEEPEAFESVSSYAVFLPVSLPAFPHLPFSVLLIIGTLAALLPSLSFTLLEKHSNTNNVDVFCFFFFFSSSVILF